MILPDLVRGFDTPSSSAMARKERFAAAVRTLKIKNATFTDEEYNNARREHCAWLKAEAEAMIKRANEWLRGHGVICAIADAKEIKKLLCKEYNLSKTAIECDRRIITITKPRQIGYYLCAEYTLLSLPHIGRIFGGRNHKSVYHGIRKIKHRRATNPAFDAEIAALEVKLRDMGIGVEPVE